MPCDEDAQPSRSSAEPRGGSRMERAAARAPWLEGRALDGPAAQAFAAKWVETWNRRELETILAQFAEDAVFSSPLAASLIEGCDGVIRGRRALEDYWREALSRNPALNFELIGCCLGVEAVLVVYRHQDETVAGELLRFRGATVVEGHATRLVAGSQQLLGLRR